MTELGGAVLDAPPHKVIETERLRLRTLQLSDAEALLDIIKRPEVMMWTSHAPVTTIDQARSWTSARALGLEVFNFIVELKAEPQTSPLAPPKIIGVLGSFHPPEVGYLLDPVHHGKGYATEALRAFIPAMFEFMPSAVDGGTGFDHLEAVTDKENHASQRVMVKAGFTYCETRLQGFDSPTLGLRDTVWYRLARPGKTLEELGLLPDQKGSSDSPPTPPVQ